MASLTEDLVETLQAGYRYALALTHHHYEAEDLVQEAWIRVWRKYGNRSTRALLFTAVRNRFLDGVRRGKIISFSGFDDEETSGIQSEKNSHNFQPGGSLDTDILLAHLRPDEREALYLNIVEGYTAKEIGRMTRESRGTILSRIHRAREKLRNDKRLRSELDGREIIGEQGKEKV